MDDFFSAFDAKIQTDVGILDFSGAFHTVPHQRLMGKLTQYNISKGLSPDTKLKLFAFADDSITPNIFFI